RGCEPRTQLVLATVETAAAGRVPPAIATLMRGVTTPMTANALKHSAVALALGLIVGGAAVALTRPAPVQPPPPPPAPAKAEAGPAEVRATGAQRATRLGRDAHAQAAALDKLPRLDYQVRYRWAVVDSMRAVNEVTPERLRAAVTAPVR